MPGSKRVPSVRPPSRPRRNLLARPRKWTDEQRTEAERLYVGVGLAEASVQTGIPKGTIVSWAHEQGLQTFGNSSTREATAAAIERRRLVFEEVTLGMVKLEQEILRLASSTHNVFVGQAGTTAYVAEQWEPHLSTTHAPAAPFPTARGGWQMRAGLRSSWGILDGLEAAGEAQPQNGPGR